VRILLDDKGGKKNQSTFLEGSGAYALEGSRFKEETGSVGKGKINQDSEKGSKAKDSASKKKSSKKKSSQDAGGKTASKSKVESKKASSKKPEK